jgi:methylmalonyl-CoA/ethylmalonyl-CoA epimerase
MPTNGLEFHHLGVACERIDDETEFWTGLGYRAEGEPFVDGEQGIRARFMTGGGPRIELIEALEGSQTLSPWLKRYTKFYHMGYFAEDFDTAFEEVRSRRAVVLRAPVQSTYFGARIAFLLMPNSAVIEIMERRH